MPPPLRPCIQPGCGAMARDGRCPLHRRNRNLARDLLDQIARRDRYVCCICGGSVDMGLRGTAAKERPSLHHLRGTSDAPENLGLAHFDCNSAYG